MTTKDTGGSARDLPLYPYSDQPDERTKGVLLLDHDDECKTTARLVGGLDGCAWLIADWEVHECDGAPHWFNRGWHTVSEHHIALLSATLAARKEVLMTRFYRQLSAAARQYDNMTPPDPVEIDTAEYEQQLRESNDFRTETIGNDAQAIADAYTAKEHLPHVIDCILDDAAERVIAQALADSNDTTARGLHDACREMVSRYTRYDRRAA